MMMVCHHLSPLVPEDVSFAESRIRRETIAAEDILHDMGVLSIMSSDSQAMGRVAEVTTRNWQTADCMKKTRGPLPEDTEHNDNYRIKRYLAKITLNPAITHGISNHVGTLQPGRIADIVLWSPKFFGIKPKMIVKGGMIVYSVMGDPNASIPTTEPVRYRPMWGSLGSAPHSLAVTFTSKLALKNGIDSITRRPMIPVQDCRNISKSDMLHNDATPDIHVNPETYEVRVDGNIISDGSPAKKVSMGRLYSLY